MLLRAPVCLLMNREVYGQCLVMFTLIFLACGIVPDMSWVLDQHLFVPHVSNYWVYVGFPEETQTLI